MSVHPALVFLAGLVALTIGAELVLRGASRIASLLGIKPLLIGMTVVAVGTSAPELAVGITAALEGKGDLAVANIAGTNIFNILFIMGLTAAIRPLPLHSSSLRLEVPVMVLSAIALFVMAWDGVLGRIDGIVLVVAAVIFTVALVRSSRQESTHTRQEYAEEFGPKALHVRGGFAASVGNGGLLLVGIALTIAGAHLLVDGASALARMAGVSDVIIGLTIVAIGTSAPELVTTIVATIKDDRDVAVGNLIGSSISNILVILGLTCVAAPDGIDVSEDVLWIDLPLGAAVCLACYPVFRSDGMVSRREGIAFVLTYLAYLATLTFVRA